ncbi:hypothetical protein KIN20_003573 [Parelaphostrongylus tenuis]|nr:hypothetical protein KIN20_003573 [Parelaphostrongylus tenuis]
MNFIDRLENVVNVLLGSKFFVEMYEGTIKAFRKKFGPQFKDQNELISKASFVFTNSNPYLDYPRPMLHKTVPIGGITVSVNPKKNKLSKKWHDVLNKRKTTVLVSFGSIAESIYMPPEYKKALLQLFESMPETTFIWKYEEEGSDIAKHLENVYPCIWVPQNALLADPRLTVFVAHGGLGSITELAYMGKPAIVIPIFSDQVRNANMLSKHGGAIVLTRHDLENAQTLRTSLYEIFNNASFSENARLLSDILQNQPISPKQLLIRHSEFAAKFGTLPNLDSYGRHLSLVQYYLIDILLACGFVLVLAAITIVMILKKCFCKSAKNKTE